ncbi:MAG: 4-hydroxybenzoate octaprenyltransferase [Planctomycetota bacterium]|nr:MAG: 4-hydroxybenzoate octaprenyltransferase [Planctomycetota bacterium]
MSRLARVLRMIRFEHSVFALPFALAGAWLAAGGLPPIRDLAGTAVAAVAGRSAAMAFNRLADRRFDASNPRTADRELVTGSLEVGWTSGFTLVCSLLFVVTSFWLAPICGWLSLPVLALLLGYSLLKRFTLLCHFGLGLALACAPCGAWLAVAKAFRPGWPVPLWIGAGVVAWVAGFDLLYAIQDIDHDRREGLHSIPARFGQRRSRRLAAGLHLLAVALWIRAGVLAGLGPGYAAGLLLVALLLAAEHLVLRGGRIDRVPLAFFRINAWVGPAFFTGVLAGIHLGGPKLAG